MEEFLGTSARVLYFRQIISYRLPGIMKTKHSTLFTRVMTIALAASPALAQAHPGEHHLTGLVSGVAHPLLGLDHLLAMIAVGLWATQLGGRALWAVPASFLAVMASAASLAMSGIALPGVEQGIVASLLMLGVLIAAAVRIPTTVSVALVSLFAFFHGQAHGVELPASAGAVSYGVGFALSTAALHLAGLGCGLALRSAMALRFAGAAVAVTATLMLLNLL